MARFPQGYQDPRPNQKGATDTSPNSNMGWLLVKFIFQTNNRRQNMKGKANVNDNKRRDL